MQESPARLLPPLFTAGLITIVYISLGHFHVKSLRERESLKTELNELRTEYISVKSNLMKQSKQSELARRLEAEGIRELRTPPVIIEKDKEE